MPGGHIRNNAGAPEVAWASYPSPRGIWRGITEADVAGRTLLKHLQHQGGLSCRLGSKGLAPRCGSHSLSASHTAEPRRC